MTCSPSRLQASAPPFVFDFVQSSHDKAGQIRGHGTVIRASQVGKHLILPDAKLARDGPRRVQLIGGHVLPPKTKVVCRLDYGRNGNGVSNIEPFAANPCGAKYRVRPELNLTSLVIVQQRRVQNLGAGRSIPLERDKALYGWVE